MPNASPTSGSTAPPRRYRAPYRRGKRPLRQTKGKLQSAQHLRGSRSSTPGGAQASSVCSRHHEFACVPPVVILSISCQCPREKPAGHSGGHGNDRARATDGQRGSRWLVVMFNLRSKQFGPSAQLAFVAFPLCDIFPTRQEDLLCGVNMRAFKIFFCLVLVAIPSFAGPGCGIVMIFQHPPKQQRTSTACSP